MSLLEARAGAAEPEEMSTGLAFLAYVPRSLVTLTVGHKSSGFPNPSDI